MFRGQMRAVLIVGAAVAVVGAIIAVAAFGQPRINPPARSTAESRLRQPAEPPVPAETAFRLLTNDPGSDLAKSTQMAEPEPTSKCLVADPLPVVQAQPQPRIRRLEQLDQGLPEVRFYGEWLQGPTAEPRRLSLWREGQQGGYQLYQFGLTCPSELGTWAGRIGGEVSLRVVGEAQGWKGEILVATPNRRLVAAIVSPDHPTFRAYLPPDTEMVLKVRAADGDSPDLQLQYKLTPGEVRELALLDAAGGEGLPPVSYVRREPTNRGDSLWPPGQADGYALYEVGQGGMGPVPVLTRGEHLLQVAGPDAGWSIQVVGLVMGRPVFTGTLTPGSPAMAYTVTDSGTSLLMKVKGEPGADLGDLRVASWQ